MTDWDEWDGLYQAEQSDDDIEVAPESTVTCSMSSIEHIPLLEFKVSIAHGHSLKILIEILRTYYHKGTFVFSHSGVTHTQVDVQQRATVHINIPRESSPYYEYSHEQGIKEARLSLDFNEFKKACKAIGKKDSVKLIKEKGTTCIKLKLVRPKGMSGQDPIIDISRTDNTIYDIPNVKESIHVCTVDVTEFTERLKLLLSTQCSFIEVEASASSVKMTPLSDSHAGEPIVFGLLAQESHAVEGMKALMNKLSIDKETLCSTLKGDKLSNEDRVRLQTIYELFQAVEETEEEDMHMVIKIPSGYLKNLGMLGNLAPDGMVKLYASPGPSLRIQASIGHFGTLDLFFR